MRSFLFLNNKKNSLLSINSTNFLNNLHHQKHNSTHLFFKTGLCSSSPTSTTPNQATSFRMASTTSNPSSQDPTSMKIVDIKNELETLGAKDKMFQGMEKSDLVELLIQARKNPPPPTTAAAATSSSSSQSSTSSASLAALLKSTFGAKAESRAAALRFGDVMMVGNKRNPTALVTFCHGLGDTCHGWAQGMEMEVAPSLPHVLFLLPTAPHQPVSMNMGYSMPAWYDIKGLGERSSEDPEGVAISCEYLERKAKEACDKYNISKTSGRVVYAGFSQGGALSLALGLVSREVKPAGIAALSSYLAARDFVLPNIVNGEVPIQQFHGTADPMVSMSLAQKSKETLEETGKVKNIADIKVYRGMQHSSCAQEMNDFVEFLKKVLP